MAVPHVAMAFSIDTNIPGIPQVLITFAQGDSANSVTRNMILNPPEGAHNQWYIMWESSHPNIVTSSGTVTRPARDTNVDLTLWTRQRHFVHAPLQRVNTFTVTVIGESQTNHPNELEIRPAGYYRWTSNINGTPIRHGFYQEYEIIHHAPIGTRMFLEYYIVNTRDNRWYRTSNIEGLGRGTFWIYSGNLTSAPLQPPVNTVLAGLFSHNSYTYNHDLARFSAGLNAVASNQATTHAELQRLGFQQIRAHNFVNPPNRHTAAHTFAYQEIMIDGDKRNLIVVTIRGTHGWDEWVSNAILAPWNETHTGFEWAENNVWVNFNQYLVDHGLTDARYNTVLITGYSRGGAVANLLAVNLNRAERAPRTVFQNNLHAYTFATPNVSQSSRALTERYRNIFNIINRNDFVPTVPTSIGLSNNWNRYGRDLITNMPNSPDAPRLFPSHSMATYVHWMETNPNMTYEIFRQFMMINTRFAIGLSIKCPVDIRVYDNRERLVGEIINDVARNVDNSDVVAFVVDGTKHFFLPYDDVYTIRFTATGDGVMTYIIESIDTLSDTPPATSSFENVRLYRGRQLTSEISNISDVRLHIVENDVIVGEIATNGMETRFPTTPEVLPFSDVNSNNWFYPYIRHVFENNIMQGTTTTTFAPNTNFSRAQVVATLYRMAHGGTAREIPYARNRNIFSDVNVNTWYSPYVAWAYDNGIVTGVGNNRFAPNDNVTREQFATMIHRFAEFREYNTTVRQSSQWNSFTDRNQTSTWAREGLTWANYHGLITGRTTTTIVPGGTAIRAEASAILTRFMQTFEN